MRLDKYLVDNHFFETRQKAQFFIKQGKIKVDGVVCNKPSFIVNEKPKIEILDEKQYVSRGAYKLLGAVEKFNLDFKDKIVLDLGASTGGFTQVALEKGAKKVYAVDIGKSELHKLLKSDKRAVDLPNTDVRNLKKAEVGDFDILIGDLSFISLTKVLPYLFNEFGKIKEGFLLFKPQFECGKDIAKKYKGIIKNKDIHIKILNNFVNFVENLGNFISDIDFSPIKGGDGNIEYLIYFNENTTKNYNIEEVIDRAFSILK